MVRPGCRKAGPERRSQGSRVLVFYNGLNPATGQRLTARRYLQRRENGRMIEEDIGFEVSRAVAREMVVYHRRAGGQSQFSTMLEMEPESDRIRRALAFARDHLSEPLSVERLAEVACISPRHFGRAFRAETGETPAKAVERLRTEAAQHRVEAGTEPIQEIAASAGFSDPERMRRAFLRRFGQPPQALRRSAYGSRVLRPSR